MTDKTVSAILAWVRGMPCLLPFCDELAEPHHVYQPRGRFPHLVVPLCHEHHDEGGNGGWGTFQQKYGVPLVLIAHVIYECWKKVKPRPEL